MGKLSIRRLRDYAAMKIKNHLRLAMMVLSGAIVLLAASPAFSQNCALCYTQAASSGARMIEALKSGILILIIPPTLGSVGMIFLLHHRSNQFRNMDQKAEGSREAWQESFDSEE